MPAICSTDYDDHQNNHATNTFNAEVHIYHFENIFDYFNLNFKSWVLCQIVDSAAANRKMLKYYQGLISAV